MPTDYDKRLTPAVFQDLMAFLTRLYVAPPAAPPGRGRGGGPVGERDRNSAFWRMNMKRFFAAAIVVLASVALVARADASVTRIEVLKVEPKQLPPGTKDA